MAVNLLVVFICEGNLRPRSFAPFVNTALYLSVVKSHQCCISRRTGGPYHRKHQSNGFVGHGVEMVVERDSVARTIVEPDNVDRFLDNGVPIRQPLPSVIVYEG